MSKQRVVSSLRGSRAQHVFQNVVIFGSNSVGKVLDCVLRSGTVLLRDAVWHGQNWWSCCTFNHLCVSLAERLFCEQQVNSTLQGLRNKGLSLSFTSPAEEDVGEEAV